MCQALFFCYFILYLVEIFLFSWSPVAFKFFRKNCFFRPKISESWGKNFAMYCNAPRNDFNSLHDIGGFNCNKVFIFSLFSFVPCSVISCHSQMLSLKKKLDFFSLVLYPSSWSFFNILIIFSWCLSLSSLVTITISSIHTGV